jgi:hypothetical protein
MRALAEACASLSNGLFGEKVRFKLVEKPFRKDQMVSLGDYGLQKNPRYFIIGAIGKGGMARESYGYLMEQMVLKVTELGLGSCWLGIFNRQYFSDFSSADDEIVPAIITLGIAAGKPRFGERIMRFGIGANSRKDWNELFFSGTLGQPLSREEAGPYSEPLEMLRLAPSAGNTQCWRIVKDKGANAFHFHISKRKASYYDAGLHNIDIGIAMCHFELSAREKGLAGDWKVAAPKTGALPEGTEYRVSWLPR